MNYTLTDMLLFFLFSFAEFLAIFIMMMWLFRFKFKNYQYSIYFLTAILTVISWVVRNVFGEAAYAPILLISVLILLFYVLSSISLIWCAFMGVLAYVGYGLVQAIIIFVPDWLGWYSFREMSNTSVTAYCIQTVSAAAYIGLAYLLKHNRLGLTFVSPARATKVRMNGMNITILIVLIVSFLMMALWYQIRYLPYIIFIFIADLSLLLYAAFWKENQK
ncbi:hypothetical protein ACFQI7_09535 [Paenibacillus allorhizosphaerae]|uniref:Uncharacterized protein n=1 Tax=Paenibacillus allorhizosphaerae TaxID=2849866 RepID=A0ABN7TKN5_9BACL|nr:hypothetical protein [Paenibacillus allorhizosphaerae]CAG7644291.1 hypothetical protein PAECIP111802_03218 [Paenibacillus allorhizosphaerae]